MYVFLFKDEFKGHSLLQAARESDVARIKKHLSLETVNFKHPQTHETALVISQDLLIILHILWLT